MKFIQVIKILFITILFTLSSATQAALPKIEHWKTLNSVQVYFVQTKQVPMVDIETVFNAGSAHDDKIPGLAYLTNKLLDQGTKNLTVDQIADSFATVGAEYSAKINRDMARVHLRSLTDAKYLNSALNTFQAVLTQANFPENAIQRVKEQILISLQVQQENPMKLAQKTFFAELYDKQAYGHCLLGTAESINKITITDIQNFYKNYYVAKNAIFIMVGAIDKNQATIIAEKLSQALPVGKAIENIPIAVALTQSREKQINFPSTQTTIMLGGMGITPQANDFFPLLVGNHILGGGALTSRLFTEVREKRGLSYGIQSEFIPWQAKGPFLIAWQSRTDQAQTALKVTRQVLTDFIQNGPTENELIAAKKNLTGNFPLTVANNAQMLEHLVQIGIYHLPLNYLDTYQYNIAAVTREQIKAAFQRTLELDKLITVKVGG